MRIAGLWQPKDADSKAAEEQVPVRRNKYKLAGAAGSHGKSKKKRSSSASRATSPTKSTTSSSRRHKSLGKFNRQHEDYPMIDRIPTAMDFSSFDSGEEMLEERSRHSRYDLTPPRDMGEMEDDSNDKYGPRGTVERLWSESMDSDTPQWRSWSNDETDNIVSDVIGDDEEEEEEVMRELPDDSSVEQIDEEEPASPVKKKSKSKKKKKKSKKKKKKKKVAAKKDEEVAQDIEEEEDDDFMLEVETVLEEPDETEKEDTREVPAIVSDTSSLTDTMERRRSSRAKSPKRKKRKDKESKRSEEEIITDDESAKPKKTKSVREASISSENRKKSKKKTVEEAITKSVTKSTKKKPVQPEKVSFVEEAITKSVTKSTKKKPVQPEKASSSSKRGTSSGSEGTKTRKALSDKARKQRSRSTSPSKRSVGSDTKVKKTKAATEAKAEKPTRLLRLWRRPGFAEKKRTKTKATTDDSAKGRSRSTSPSKRSMSPFRRSVSPSKRSTTPSRRSMSPSRRSTSPFKRSMSPSRRSTSPFKRSMSPSRRSTSPQRKRFLHPFLSQSVSRDDSKSRGSSKYRDVLEQTRSKNIEKANKKVRRSRSRGRETELAAKANTEEAKPQQDWAGRDGAQFSRKEKKMTETKEKEMKQEKKEKHGFGLSRMFGLGARPGHDETAGALDEMREMPTKKKKKISNVEKAKMYNKSLLTMDSESLLAEPAKKNKEKKRLTPRERAQMAHMQELDEFSVAHYNEDDPQLVQCLRFYYCGTAANCADVTIKRASCQPKELADASDTLDEIEAQRIRDDQEFPKVEVVLQDGSPTKRKRAMEDAFRRDARDDDSGQLLDEAPDIHLARVPSFVREVTGMQLHLDEDSEEKSKLEAIKRAQRAAERDSLSITTIEIPVDIDLDHTGKSVGKKKKASRRMFSRLRRHETSE